MKKIQGHEIIDGSMFNSMSIPLNISRKEYKTISLFNCADLELQYD